MESWAVEIMFIFIISLLLVVLIAAIQGRFQEPLQENKYVKGQIFWIAAVVILFAVAAFFFLGFVLGIDWPAMLGSIQNLVGDYTLRTFE